MGHTKSQVKKALSPFAEAVQRAVRSIPTGRVASYGQIALLIGMPRAAQAVGQTLHFLDETTPWHRVINRTGRLLTKCHYHTFLEQKQILEKENIEVFEEEGVFRINMKKYQWVNDDADLKRFLVRDREGLNRRIELT